MYSIWNYNNLWYHSCIVPTHVLESIRSFGILCTSHREKSANIGRISTASSLFPEGRFYASFLSEFNTAIVFLYLPIFRLHACIVLRTRRIKQATFTPFKLPRQSFMDKLHAYVFFSWNCLPIVKCKQFWNIYWKWKQTHLDIKATYHIW